MGAKNKRIKKQAIQKTKSLKNCLFFFKEVQKSTNLFIFYFRKAVYPVRKTARADLLSVDNFHAPCRREELYLRAR